MAGVELSRAYEPDTRHTFPHLLHSPASTRAASCPTSAHLRGWLRESALAPPDSRLGPRAASIDLGVLQAAAAAALGRASVNMQTAVSPVSSGPSPSKGSSGDVQTLSVMARELTVADDAPASSPAGRQPQASAPPPPPEAEIKAATRQGRPQQPSPHQAGMVAQEQRCPPHGIKAICGRRPRMEDAFSAIPFLLELPVPQFPSHQSEIYPARMGGDSAKPEHSGSADAGLGALAAAAAAAAASEGPNGGSSTGEAQQEAETPQAPYLETLHFFGVFDGHGGADAAVHCAQTLHQRIVEAVTSCGTGQDALPPSSTEGPAADADAAPVPADSKAQDVPAQQPASPPTAGEPSSLSEHDAIIQASLAEHEESAEPQDGRTQACSSHKFENALAQAFSRVDEEFGKGEAAALVGTTVVVALVGSRHLYIANCGDSRAVLCRGDVAMPLTDDHKAAREDEVARIEALGGQILYWNGVRVMGVLAVSRAVGDHCLRPYVIAQPEVTIVARRPDDELLLLASDGLWDVLSNQEAVTLAKRCLRRALQRGASRQSAARIAATVLTRAAFDRGSRDNVTVVVVDLGAFQDLEPGMPSARHGAEGGSKGASEDGSLTADPQNGSS